jgi:hypothetical protein
MIRRPVTGSLYEWASDDEKNSFVMERWQNRGPLYGMWCAELMADYNPAFAKLHYWGTPDGGDLVERTLPDLLLWSVHNIASYMMYGWETGILNEFNTLRRLGMPKEQVMEIIMFAQLYAGMRGLGHTYRAVGDFLPAWGPPTATMEWPEGWAADPEAFKSGLDLSTREMTAADRKSLDDWYEKNVGYVREVGGRDPHAPQAGRSARHVEDERDLPEQRGAARGDAARQVLGHQAAVRPQPLGRRGLLLRRLRGLLRPRRRDRRRVGDDGITAIAEVAVGLGVGLVVRRTVEQRRGEVG